MIVVMSAVRVRKIRARDRRPNSRLLLRVIAAAVVAWGAFFIFQFFHDSSADYQRAMADCIQERNKAAAPSSGEDASAAAMACATSTSGAK
jgi:hypothetical protein